MTFGSSSGTAGGRILDLDPLDRRRSELLTEKLMDTSLRRVGAGVGLAVCAMATAEGLGLKAFRRLVEADVQALLDGASRREPKIISEDMLDGLPEPVQRYLTYTGVLGMPMARTVHLRQTGKLLLGPGQPWIPLKAEQWYSVQPPAFVWDGTLHLGPVPLIRARDMYRMAEGRMLIKAASLVTLDDAKGEEMNHSEMMRHLSEIIWFPSAFLEDNISFEAIDARSAHVTLTDRGRTATGTLLFDAEGRLNEFQGRRYAAVGGNLQTWSVPITAYGQFEGLKLPVRLKAVWRLPDGDLDYIHVTITELRYDT